MPQTFSPIVRIVPASADPTVPVYRGHIGGAQPANDNGHSQLDSLVTSQPRFEIDIREDGLVGICIDSDRAHRCAHDVEMGQIDRVILLRGHGRDSERLGVNDFVPSVRALADFTHAL